MVPTRWGVLGSELVLADDGNLYWLEVVANETGGGVQLVSFTPDGIERLRVDVDDAHAAYSLTAQGHVLILVIGAEGAYGNYLPRIEARRATDGGLLWRNDTGLAQAAETPVWFPVAVGDTAIAYPDTRGLVCVESATGVERWLRKSASGDLTRPLLGDERDRILTLERSYSRQEARLAALDRHGSELWSQSLGAEPRIDPYVEAVLDGLAIEGGTLTTWSLADGVREEKPGEVVWRTSGPRRLSFGKGFPWGFASDGFGLLLFDPASGAARSSDRIAGPHDRWRQFSPIPLLGAGGVVLQPSSTAVRPQCPVDDSGGCGDHPGGVVQEVVVLDREGDIIDRCPITMPPSSDNLVFTVFDGASLAVNGRIFLRAKPWGTNSEDDDRAPLRLFALDAPDFVPASGWTTGGNFSRTFRPR